MPTFNEATASCPVGGVVTIPSPMSGDGSPIKEPVCLSLTSVSEKGVYSFRATWLGVYLGDVQGKPDAAMSWRFSDGG